MSVIQTVNVNGKTYTREAAQHWLIDYQAHITRLQGRNASREEISRAYEQVQFYQYILDQFN